MQNKRSNEPTVNTPSNIYTQSDCERLWQANKESKTIKKNRQA